MFPGSVLRPIGISALACATVLFVSCAGPARNDYALQVAPRWAAHLEQESEARKSAEIPSSMISFDTTEGTFMNVDVSPDGGALIFDLLGDIYRLPSAGGEGVPLTSDRSWDQAPRFSPDGRHVYFVSDREGYKNLWRLDLSDRSLQQITHSDSDIGGGPNWSQDGSYLLAGVADPETQHVEFILQVIDPDDGRMVPVDAPDQPWMDMTARQFLRQPIRVFSGVASADGHVFFSSAKRHEDLGRTTVRLHVFDRGTQTRTAITPMDAPYDEYKPQLSHDGDLLAYFRQYNDRRTEIRILRRSTGEDRALIEVPNADDANFGAVQDPVPNYAFTPNDRQLIFSHGGRIHRVNLADGTSEIIPFHVRVEREVRARVTPTVRHFTDHGEAMIVRWPSVSRDGRIMAFAAIGYVWTMDLRTGDIRRLTRSDDFEYMPAISPDGKSVAYISFANLGDDYGSGRLMVAEVDGEGTREVLADPAVTHLLPTWSPDGSTIALIREKEAPEGTLTDFGWTLAASGLFHGIGKAPAAGQKANLLIYARYVGFDEAGDRLLFSFPRTYGEIVLAAAALDGTGRETIAIGGPDVGGIVPAPDMSKLALTRSDGTVWILPFGSGRDQSRVSTSSPQARRVSDGGGYYVNWSAPGQFTFAFGQDVYRYRSNERALDTIHVRVIFSKPEAAQPIAFERARLITMNGDPAPVIESGTLVVDGSRITAVGPTSEVSIPSDALVIDAMGKTIVPGFIDTHYHRIGGFNTSAFALPKSDFSDRSAITYGVTTAWEPGGKRHDAAPATVDLQAAGRISGPRWSHSAQGAVGYPWEFLTSYAAARAAVARHRELGVDVLKEYATLTREQRQWLSSAAHRAGLGIVSHIDNFDGMMMRIVDGYTGGDHPYIPVPFHKDVRELLARTGFIWTPNIAMNPGTAGRTQGKQRYFCHEVLTWQNKTGHRANGAESICPSDVTAPTVPYGTQRGARVARQSALAASEGVHIGMSAHAMPAWALHREMWYLWKGGMPAGDVLRATTIGNAEKLGLQDEIGSLESGKMADFILLDGNPLDGILNTLSLKYTVQGGVVYDSATAERVDLTGIGETNSAAVHQYN